MLYLLLAPLGKLHLFFNLFTYISFRAAGAMVTALLMAFVTGPGLIRRLKAHKVGQVIRAEGPASHERKRGTPTMGGIIIIAATVIPTLLWASLSNRFVLVAVAATLWTGAIGFVDDYLKVVEGRSRGLVAKWKLAAQVAFGVCLGVMLLVWPVVEPSTMPDVRHHGAVLQVSRGGLRAVALRRVRDRRGHGLLERRESHRRPRRPGRRALDDRRRRHSPSSPTCSAAST